MQTNHVFLPVIKEMLICCREIHDLLKQDSDQFSKDQLVPVEESNNKKMALITKLTTLIGELNTDEQKDLLGTIIQNKTLPDEQIELRSLAKQLHDEIQNCYKYIVMNSKIVFSNLEMLKDIGDKLTALKTANQETYNETGSIDKW